MRLRISLPLGLLALTLCACEEAVAPAPPPLPGPVPLRSEGQMRAFLAESRFDLVGRDVEPEWWDFREEGRFEALRSGESLTGTWTASEDSLTLTVAREGEPGVESVLTEELMLPLRWLDGKLNIEIDGRQYRRQGGFLGR